MVVFLHMKESEQELMVTRAMMLGCSFVYDDYGHPERAYSRKYWQCLCPPTCTAVGYGYTQAAAAYDWLWRTGHLKMFA